MPIVKIPFGPQHPALKEPISFTFDVEGEKIVKVSPRIGYVHRGIEKAAEQRTYMQGLYLVERTCGICSHAHSTTYCQGIESLHDITIPPRAAYIRVIIGELERLHSHSLWLGFLAKVIGFDTFFMHIWTTREIVMELLETISGNRVNYAMNIMGGVTRDLNASLQSRLQKDMEKLEVKFKNHNQTFTSERTIEVRTRDVGKLTPKDAQALCAVGPTVRASGINTDLRRDDPYAAYDEIPFDVITDDGCDVYARLLVRSQEVLESIKIIQYAVKHLPQGPITVKVPPRAPPNEAVTRIEAPRGELLHYVQSDGTKSPSRYKIRAPTLSNLPAVAHMLLDQYIADIPTVVAGIDPCFACMDR